MINKSKQYFIQSFFFFTFTFLVIILFSWRGVQGAQTDWFAEQKEGHPKIESSLYELQKNYLFFGREVAHSLAHYQALRLNVQDKITVFIHPEVDGKVGMIDEEALKLYGVEIIKKGDSLIKAEIPVYLLMDIAEHVKGISFIRNPDRPYISSKTEGVNLTGASYYHSLGFKGEGVKVAIIDIGFARLEDAILAGALPPNVIKIDCTGSSCALTDFSFEEEDHGTAVAEIVHAMAPDAQLYLIKVGDTLDLKDAKDYCITNGVRIINHSVGWYGTNFYDGNCYFDNSVCTADHAFRNNILWVNSAGNHARKHYGVTFIDRDGDRFHNVTWNENYIQLYANSGDPIIAVLTWDSWPETDLDFDLLLFNRHFELVASSTNIQNGTQPPFEAIYYLVPSSGTYYLAIKRSRGLSNPRFSLFTFYHELNPFTARSSLLSPSDARGVMAVAAIDYAQWESGPQEWFSSQGPTEDGRIKPEISGPDGVSSFIYGNFYGTSASSPHVAGAAALLLSHSPMLTVEELWNALTASAIGMGESGQDTIYGFGRLNLLTISVDPTSIDFGEVPKGSFIERTITVRNLGNQNLMIGQITSLAHPFSIVSDQCSNCSLPLGGGCTLKVRFSPNSPDLFEETLVIPTNDPLTGNLNVPLKGRGILLLTLSSPNNQAIVDLCSINIPLLFRWKSLESFVSYEVQFSGNANFDSIPLKVNISGRSIDYQPFSFQWRKILLIPGSGGGMVYWRVLGKKSDGTFIVSDSRSLLVPPPSAVVAPTIAPVSRSSLPILAWENRCNIKFKVWFGSDPNFSNHRSLNVYLTNPDQKSGGFSKTLEPHQWLVIRRLVADRTGSTIYWYVESWDELRRRAVTHVMSFTLND